MKKYLPSQFERKWIDTWEKEQTYETPSFVPTSSRTSAGKEKMYVLDMFPYPSAAGLHMGHPRGYTATDILSRYYRMNDYSVLHPMGWDAFGLPAENAAIKNKKNPMDMVPDHIANFKRQMQMLGFSYDWNKELATTDPAYYKWTQWLFIQFFKMGILYKKDTPVNYCPFCRTGLAEEEVLPNGTHERCGNAIVKKLLPQWLFRITTYADRLLEDLEGLNWPDGILQMQRNWIGRKEGINITYKIKDSAETITCFTTRPDTNFGATFIVLAPEHELVSKIINDKNTPQKYSISIKDYVKRSVSKTDLERITEGRKKTGVFAGYYAINNLTGKLMPIWLSDFVLKDFGTGAVVGVPGHDIRDFEFAKEFGIEVIRVVVGKDGDASPITEKKQVHEDEGKMTNSDFLNGLDIHDATKKVMDYIEDKGWGKKVVSYHIRDWIFSRQRYWGEPIPMVYCSKCDKNKISWWDTNDGKAFLKDYQSISKVNKEIQESLYGWFPIDEKSLPLELPYLESYEPPGDGKSPLSTVKEWVKATCPNCSGEATRETDTMPNWAGSCWYFIRFAQIQNEKLKVKNYKSLKEEWEVIQKEADPWLSADWYFGGAEHAVLHLLYSRFWVKAIYDLGLIDFKEPFIRLRNVGMVLAEDHRKMSKSLGNVINPDDVVKEFGADAVRLYEMFMAPFSQEIAWSTNTLQGSYRFLNRVWNLTQRDMNKNKDDQKLISKFNKTIVKVADDILNVKFNTAIAMMMEFINDWEKSKIGLSCESIKKFLQILSPFAPFMTEELWRDTLTEKNSIHLSFWPEVNKESLVENEISIPVQVNGKVRVVVVVPVDKTDQETVVKKALEEKRVKRFLGGKKYQTIYVKGKILNFVI